MLAQMCPFVLPECSMCQKPEANGQRWYFGVSFDVRVRYLLLLMLQFLKSTSGTLFHSWYVNMFFQWVLISLYFLRFYSSVIFITNVMKDRFEDGF